MDRRKFCANSLALAVIAASTGLPGCRSAADKLELLKNHGSAELPLVIDTHVHTFNGSDLQVSKFVSKVAVNEVESSAIRFLARMFGPVLQHVAWSLAPEAAREIEILDDYIGRQLQQRDFEQSVAQSKNDQYTIAKRELERATIEAVESAGESAEQYLEPVESMSEEDQAISSLLNLPETYDDLFVSSPGESGLGDHWKKLRAAQRFLVEMFQYRHVSTIRYFETYRTDQVVVDLATPCMVDYDWWLDGGAPTRSRIPTQVEVNEKIAALSHGRVHPFAPYDPLRQVLWDETESGGFSPMNLVKDAIENRGFLGVKLYPPMGFGVYGNGTVDHGDIAVWQGKDLHPISQTAGFGVKLDAALDKLFDYCAKEGVAIMAHSNPSNLAHKDFAVLLDIDHWRALYDKHTVRASFGHFNGLGSGQDEGRWQEFVDLLNSEADSNLRFADSSYFSNVLQGQEDLVAVLRKIMFEADGSPTAVMQKLVYGSDWKMLLMEVDSSAYLELMVGILERADQQLLEAGFDNTLSDRVMGLNAADFLGLRRDQAARKRLENFYDRFNIDEPPWMTKVDNHIV